MSPRNFIEQFNLEAELIGYRILLKLRADMDQVIRDYERKHPDVTPAPGATTNPLPDAPPAGPLPEVGDGALPIRAAKVKELLDEVLAQATRNELRGLILFRCYNRTADDGPGRSFDHFSLSLGGAALGPEDYALAGAAFTHVGLQRASWACPGGPGEEE